MPSMKQTNAVLKRRSGGLRPVSIQAEEANILANSSQGRLGGVTLCALSNFSPLGLRTVADKNTPLRSRKRVIHSLGSLGAASAGHWPGFTAVAECTPNEHRKPKGLCSSEKRSISSDHRFEACRPRLITNSIVPVGGSVPSRGQGRGLRRPIATPRSQPVAVRERECERSRDQPIQGFADCRSCRLRCCRL